MLKAAFLRYDDSLTRALAASHTLKQNRTGKQLKPQLHHHQRLHEHVTPLSYTCFPAQRHTACIDMQAAAAQPPNRVFFASRLISCKLRDATLDSIPIQILPPFISTPAVSSHPQ